MKVLVCGGRDFTDREWVNSTLDFFDKHVGIDHVVTGGARGADLLAESWAHDRLVEVTTHHADWATHGRAGGPIRNSEMLKLTEPDIVIAFPGGIGTRDMVKKAIEEGVTTLVLGYKRI